MAFGAFIQKATAVDTSGTSTTIGGAGFTTGNVTAGNLLVCGSRVGATGRTITVTSSSTPATFTQDKNAANATDGHESFIHSGPNQAGGVKPTITFAISGASASLRIGLEEYTGSSNTHTDKTAGTSGNSNAPSSGVTATRTDAAELQVGVCGIAGAGTISAGSGFTIQSSVASKFAMENQVWSSTGTDAAIFADTSSEQWTALTATYSDAAAASSRPVKMAGEWGGYAGTSGGFAG